MKDYDINKESSYWTCFWIWWNLYNKENDEGIFFEVHVQYPRNLHNLHKDLPI